MDAHTLKVLEYGEILALLAAHASNGMGRELALTLTPSPFPDVVRRRLQETREARALFVAAFPEAEQPFPQVLADSLTRCYEKLGWDMVLSRQDPAWDPPTYPTLADLQEMALRVVAEIGYDPEGRQRRSLVSFRSAA